jgi:hypothetical protein
MNPVGRIVGKEVSMVDAVLENLVLDLLEWLATRERTYEEVMDAWRTSCPKLPVWEEASDRGLVTRVTRHGSSIVRITLQGAKLLQQRRPSPRVEDGRESNLRKGTATLLVLVHLAVLVAHGSAHSQLNISLGTWQKAFIAIIIFVVPLIAMMLLWTRVRKLGVVLLGLSLAGSLVFGAGYHFLIAGPDNAFGQYHSHWGFAFRATAILLAVIEAAGFTLCILVLPAEPSGAAASDMHSRPGRGAYGNNPICRTNSERACS